MINIYLFFSNNIIKFDTNQINKNATKKALYFQETFLSIVKEEWLIFKFQT